MSGKQLSDLAVKALRPREREFWKAAGENLYLRVRPDGTKAWYARRMRHGHLLSRKLGEYPSMGVKAAAIERDNALAPDQSRSGSLHSVLNEWFAVEIEKTYRRPKQVQRYINRLPPALLATPVHEVPRLDVFRFLKAYAKRETRGHKGGPVAANRCLMILKQAFRWAVVSGYLRDNVLNEITPKYIGGKEAAGDRVLTDEEIRRLWHSNSAHTPLLRFLLLTAQRIGEAQRAHRDHIDVAARRWRIPPEHAKNGKDHWCSLSSYALDIVCAQPQDRNLVFGTATDTGVQAWLRRWCNREEINPAFTPHDLRRTAATRMNDLGVPVHVVEKILNHSLQGVLAVYNKADYETERQQAMEKWAQALVRIAGDRA